MNTNTKSIFMMLAIVTAFTIVAEMFATPLVHALDAQPTTEGGMMGNNMTGGGMMGNNMTGGGNMTAGNMTA